MGMNKIITASNRTNTSEKYDSVIITSLYVDDYTLQ